MRDLFGRTIVLFLGVIVLGVLLGLNDKLDDISTAVALLLRTVALGLSA